MKKFYFFFVLLFGLTVMTSCEKDEEVEKTEETEKTKDTEKTKTDPLVGTWIYKNPAAKEDEVMKLKFVFNANGSGSVSKWFKDGEYEIYRFKKWKLDDEILGLYFEDYGDYAMYDCYFEDGDLWLSEFDQGEYFWLEKQ